MSDPNDRLRFSVHLRKAMTARKVSKIGLASVIGQSPSNIYLYLQGKTLPTVAVASRLAEALLDNGLLEMVVAMRTRSCRICGKRTVDAGTKPRAYCSPTCYRLLHKGLSAAPVVDPRDRAIAAMCVECEPSGVCRTIACPLRAVSPLPYVQPEDIALAPASVVWTDERRAATALRMGAYWAVPEHRERQAKRVRKYATDEERRAARRASWRAATARRVERERSAA